MARRRLEGLERVLGVSALFSTAYGSVGSSIYDAPGLLASYALGPTPLVGGRLSGHREKIRAGQAGRRIIEEAQDMRATAVVMGLPRRVDGASPFGKTLETVPAERPCRVVIESAPPQPVERARQRTPARELAAR